VGILSGGGAALFGELFAPLYLRATVTQRVQTTDDRGNLRNEATDRPARVQVDAATERMRQSEGYTADDRALLVLAASLNGDLQTDCLVTVHEGPYQGATFRVASPVDRDPCAAYWSARGVRANG